MKDFITKKGIYIAIAAIVIAIIAAISVALSGGNASFAETLSQPFFRPLKSAMTTIVGACESVYDYMYKFDSVKEENEALKAQIAQLEEEYREYTETKEENNRLRELLGFYEKHQDFILTPVSVISWTASNFSSSFTISKGTDAGVSLYDAVITETGYLVGQVTEVSSTSATVTSVIDTTMSIGALVYETGGTGVTTGDFRLFRDGKLRLSYLSDSTDAVIGGTVVTSGYGGVYPSGLVIGYIEGVASESSGLDTYAVVRAAADIGDSTHLYVITDFAVNE